MEKIKNLRKNHNFMQNLRKNRAFLQESTQVIELNDEKSTYFVVFWKKINISSIIMYNSPFNKSHYDPNIYLFSSVKFADTDNAATWWLIWTPLSPIPTLFRPQRVIRRAERMGQVADLKWPTLRGEVFLFESHAN